MAARTADELRAHLRANGPSVLLEPEDLADAVETSMVSIFEEVEAAIYSLHARRYIDQADGSWLDAHGADRGVMRLTGESDDDYRVRVKAIGDGVTKPGILAAVDAMLLVGTSRMEEWPTDGMFTDVLDSRGFADTAKIHGEPRGFTVYISEQLPSRSSRGFALASPADPFTVQATGVNHTFAADANDSLAEAANGMFADSEEPTQGDIYAQIYQRIDRSRAGGLGPPPHFMVEIE